LKALCGDDRDEPPEAETATEEALCARIRFWDGILDAINDRRDQGSFVGTILNHLALVVESD